jgi:hypothetical protein
MRNAGNGSLAFSTGDFDCGTESGFVHHVTLKANGIHLKPPVIQRPSSHRGPCSGIVIPDYFTLRAAAGLVKWTSDNDSCETANGNT